MLWHTKNELLIQHNADLFTFLLLTEFNEFVFFPHLEFCVTKSWQYTLSISFDSVRFDSSHPRIVALRCTCCYLLFVVRLSPTDISHICQKQSTTTLLRLVTSTFDSPTGPRGERQEKTRDSLVKLIYMITPLNITIFYVVMFYV